MGAARLTNIDLMRVVVFTAVVSTHVVTYPLNQEELPVAAWGLVMHFARYAFVFVSAFVLCHSYQDRSLSPIRFWRRRFAAVVLPYLLWTLIYYGLETAMYGWPGVLSWLHLYLLHVFWGTEWYHLYFLVVSIQLYLVFPALRWLIDRWPGTHGWLIGIAAAIQLGYMAMVSFVPAPPAPWVIPWEHAEKALPLYLLFAVGGAVAARRQDQLNGWLTRHRRLLAGFGILSLAGCLAVFAVRAAGGSAWSAAAAGFPATLPWAVAATLICYAVTTGLVQRNGTDGLTARIASFGAHRAFGVFAIHPLVLWVIVVVLGSIFAQWPGMVLRTVITFILTLAGSLIAVELLLRTPLSRALLARRRVSAHSLINRNRGPNNHAALVDRRSRV